MSKHSALNTFGRSGNPAFTKNFGGSTYDLPLDQRMTLDGAVNKTGILLSLCFAGAFVGWNIPALFIPCLLYTSPSPRDRQKSRMPSSA